MSNEAIANQKPEPRAATLYELAQFGLIEVSGPDAERFLAAQVTSDITRSTESQSQISSWCTAKGRVITVLHIIRWRASYYLLLPADLLAVTLKRLRMFVLRAKVDVSDAGERVQKFGIAGHSAPALLEQQLGSAPAQSGAAAATGSSLVVRLHGAVPRYLVLTDPETVMPMQTALETLRRDAAVNAWNLFDIGAGVPWILSATSEAYLPQMLDLERLDGLSFNKGCYPGQEIIARLKYRGELKRRLYRGMTVTDTAPPPPGSPIFRDSDESGQSCGEILIAARQPTGESAFLAVVEIEAASLPLRIGATSGAMMHVYSDFATH